MDSELKFKLAGWCGQSGSAAASGPVLARSPGRSVARQEDHPAAAGPGPRRGQRPAHLILGVADHPRVPPLSGWTSMPRCSRRPGRSTGSRAAASRGHDGRAAGRHERVAQELAQPAQQRCARAPPTAPPRAAQRRRSRTRSAARPWRFADGNDVTIVVARWPEHMLRRIPYTERNDPDFIELLNYSELDALFELHGHLRAANPATRSAAGWPTSLPRMTTPPT